MGCYGVVTIFLSWPNVISAGQISLQKLWLFFISIVFPCEYLGEHEMPDHLRPMGQTGHSDTAEETRHGRGGEGKEEL